MSAVFDLTNKNLILTVSYIRTTRNLAGPPDFQDWWSDGPILEMSISSPGYGL